MADVHQPAPVSQVPDWPVLAQGGTLEVRLAETAAEIEAAQRLRYRVFYEEMSAIPSSEMRASGRDFDKYDGFCDHLLVVDRAVRGADGRAKVVGTYRLLRGEVAARHGGFYTSGEYDLSTVFKAQPPERKYLELGRSCVLKEYRAHPITLQLLWRGIMLYLERYPLEVMFGCASFPGTDPDQLALPLSYLHHFFRAPDGERARALPELYVEMNRMPKEAIDRREALRALPPLIKGYIRAGSYIGDGAVIDRQFNTTDVLIYFPLTHMDPRWRSHFGRLPE
jgi:putative hemolysin